MLATKNKSESAAVSPLRLVVLHQSGRINTYEARLHAFVGRHATMMLRVSLAIVFFWFGMLKLFPGSSPAEKIAGDTLSMLTFGHLAPAVSIPLLGGCEMILGTAVLLFPRARFTVPALLLHLCGTLTPLFLFPHQTFTAFPAPTILGQYIIKNLVLAAAALAILSASSGE